MSGSTLVSVDEKAQLIRLPGVPLHMAPVNARYGINLFVAGVLLEEEQPSEVLEPECEHEECDDLELPKLKRGKLVDHVCGPTFCPSDGAAALLYDDETEVEGFWFEPNQLQDDPEDDPGEIELLEGFVLTDYEGNRISL